MREDASLPAGRLLAVAALLLTAACAGRGRAEKIPRIPPDDAHERVEKNHALLVCAYERKGCPGTHLAGSITLEDLEARVPALPRDQGIIFFCG